MGIVLREVRSKAELKEFIRFPYRLHKDDPDWLPPLLIDEQNFHNPEKNKALTYCETRCFLAYKDGKVAGRVMGIIHHRYNKLKGLNDARFYAFESIEDPEVAETLLKGVEGWAMSHNIDRLIGPFGFSDKDPQGFLIEGFNQRAIITTCYNPPFYVEFMERAGFEKEIDLVEYLIPVPEEVPEFYRKIYQRTLANNKLKSVEFTKKRDLKKFIRPVLALMNETFQDIFGYNPLDEEEMEKLAREYLPVLDPNYVKVVMAGEEIVSFFIGMPDIGPGLQKARGRLLPFGIFHILREMKRTDYLILLVGGVRRDYQGKGLDVIMGTKMLESASRRGFKLINSHVELETNVKVRAEMERMGGEITKRYRVFRKAL